MVPPLVPAAVVRHPLRAPFFHNFIRHAVIQSSGRSLPVDGEQFRVRHSQLERRTTDNGPGVLFELVFVCVEFLKGKLP